VGERIFLQLHAVFLCVKVPLVKVVHHLKNVRPLTRVDLQDLLKPFFFLFNLIRVLFFAFAVQLFQEIVEVTFEPQGRVVGSLRADVEPGLCFSVNVFLLVVYLDVEIVQFVAFDYVDDESGFFFDRVGDFRQVVELVQNLNDGLERILVLGLVAELALVACDLADRNDNDPQQAQDTETLGLHSFLVENDRDEDNCGVKHVELVNQVSTV